MSFVKTPLDTIIESLNTWSLLTVPYPVKKQHYFAVFWMLVSRVMDAIPNGCCCAVLYTKLFNPLNQCHRPNASPYVSAAPSFWSPPCSQALYWSRCERRGTVKLYCWQRALFPSTQVCFRSTKLCALELGVYGNSPLLGLAPTHTNQPVIKTHPLSFSAKQSLWKHYFSHFSR